ncbi:MAG: DUF1566 domain-containing protein [archaeon]
MINKAQGTIEYLVIIAVVVVISLVVVGLLVNQTSSADNVSASVSKIGSSSGGISVSETVVDVTGNGLITLTNSSGSTLVLTKIAIGDNNKTFPAVSLVQENTKTFFLNGLGAGCSCAGFEGKTRTCPIVIYTTSEYGLEKQFTTSVSVNCVSSAIAKSGSSVVRPELPYIMFNGSKLYISPVDNAATALQWGLAWGFIGVTAQDLNNGSGDTIAVVNYYGAGTYAAKTCSDLVYGGYDDWYLPAQFQLYTMFVQRNSVTKADYASQWVNYLSDYYWSSTENNNIPNGQYWAWWVHMGVDYTSYTDKLSSKFVRCVRSG